MGNKTKMFEVVVVINHDHYWEDVKRLTDILSKFMSECEIKLSGKVFMFKSGIESNPHGKLERGNAYIARFALTEPSDYPKFRAAVISTGFDNRQVVEVIQMDRCIFDKYASLFTIELKLDSEVRS